MYDPFPSFEFFSSVYHACHPICFCLSLSLPRVINFEFPLQPHQKYYITQYGELGFSRLTQMEWVYYQFSLHFSYISLYKCWESVLFELGSERVNPEHVECYFFLCKPIWSFCFQTNGPHLSKVAIVVFASENKHNPNRKGETLTTDQTRTCRSYEVRWPLFWMLDEGPAVALTQISAYITHKNLAVRKIMEAMRTAYAKKKRDLVSTRLKQNMTQTITEHTRVCERKARTFTFERAQCISS